jgi:diguanylate cyclase (GGDEF)-like protein
MKILILDDDLNILNSMRRNLKGLDIRLFSSPEDAIKALETDDFAAVMSDMRMPGINGIDFLGHVKDVSPDTIRIMLTGHADLNSTMDAINKASVHHFLTKPFDINSLKLILEKALSDYAESNEMKIKTSQYIHRALHDSLTGLPNREKMMVSLQNAIQRSIRYKTYCAVMFMDLNKFKPINDTYGHKAGDEVLCVIGGRIKSMLRGTDIVARIGGDEFVVLLQDIKEPDSVKDVAEKILSAIEEPIAVSGGVSCFVSASIGISIFNDGSQTPETILEKADHLMYEMKKSKRANKIAISSL